MDAHERPAAPADTSGTSLHDAAVARGSSQMEKRRVAFASMSGTLIEFYDFGIYGVAAALVFPKVLFPALGPVAGTVASIATFGVAFVARPFGSVLFGHFGDRLGRKKTLVSTLILMGVATFLVGVTPTAAQVGVFAPLFVVVLRIVQGLAAGGEYAGAALFAAEHAPAKSRGFWAIFPQLGGTLAITLVNATFLITGFGMSDEAFRSWGWRIPFLISAVLVAVGLYVRLKIEETPVFKDEVARAGVSSAPVVDAFRNQAREILLAAGAAIPAYAFNYLWAVYLTGYVTQNFGITRTVVLVVGLFAGLIASVAIVASNILSDRIGRRRVVIAANIVCAVWSLLMFPVALSGSAAGFTIAVFITAFVGTSLLAPVVVFVTELFHTRYRYTGVAVSLNLSSVLGGAVLPLLAPLVVGSYGPAAMGVVVCVIGLIATVCTLRLRDTTNSSLTWEGDPGAGHPVEVATRVASADHA